MSAIFCVVLSSVGRGLEIAGLPSEKSYQKTLKWIHDSRSYSESEQTRGRDP